MNKTCEENIDDTPFWVFYLYYIPNAAFYTVLATILALRWNIYTAKRDKMWCKYVTIYCVILILASLLGGLIFKAIIFAILNF